MAENSKKVTETMIATWAKESEQNGDLANNKYYGKPLPQHLGNQARFESSAVAISSMSVANTQYKTPAK